MEAHTSRLASFHDMLKIIFFRFFHENQNFQCQMKTDEKINSKIEIPMKKYIDSDHQFISNGFATLEGRWRKSVFFQVLGLHMSAWLTDDNVLADR